MREQDGITIRSHVPNRMTKHAMSLYNRNFSLKLGKSRQALMTAHPHALADWLKAFNIVMVAIESTVVNWISNKRYRVRFPTWVKYRCTIRLHRQAYRFLHLDSCMAPTCQREYNKILVTTACAWAPGDLPIRDLVKKETHSDLGHKFGQFCIVCHTCILRWQHELGRTPQQGKNQ